MATHRQPFTFLLEGPEHVSMLPRRSHGLHNIIIYNMLIYFSNGVLIADFHIKNRFRPVIHTDTFELFDVELKALSEYRHHYSEKIMVVDFTSCQSMLSYLIYFSIGRTQYL